jgi:hypothetical protein
LIGCGSQASWKTVEVAPSYQPPRTVTLKVSQSPPGNEAVTLEMALVSELAKHDIHATPLDDAKSRPSLRVVIETWDSGSEEARRLLVGLGGLGEGDIVVVVEAVGDQGGPTIQGTARSPVGNTPDDAIRDVAELIASTVAHGTVASKAPTEASHSGYR